MKVDYNNIGIGTLAIASVLNKSNELSVAKASLILPFIIHSESLNYLAKSNTIVKSIEKLIAEKTSFFSNFNARYYDSLEVTFSSIQYLTEMGYVQFKDGKLKNIKPMEYNKMMGNRANKIFLAANNISSILTTKDANLFLNLRIEL
ncbi:three component ABC system middle component [Bizionia paragorgiae]|uniref:three component ABC system middle component n=1 Tax=Bizionia paragorgiae TaxID=283786 RepID=UPI003A913F27